LDPWPPFHLLAVPWDPSTLELPALPLVLWDPSIRSARWDLQLLGPLSPRDSRCFPPAPEVLSGQSPRLLRWFLSDLELPEDLHRPMHLSHPWPPSYPGIPWDR